MGSRKLDPLVSSIASILADRSYLALFALGSVARSRRVRSLATRICSRICSYVRILFAMCCLPHRKEVVLPYLHQPDSPYHVAPFHSVNRNEFYYLAWLSESDDCLRVALHNMNVRWAMLTGREENTNRKAARPDDGWQWKANPTLGLWQSLGRFGWGRLARPWINPARFRPVDHDRFAPTMAFFYQVSRLCAGQNRSVLRTPVLLGGDVNSATGNEQAADYLQSAEDGTANFYFNRMVGTTPPEFYYASVSRDGETRGPTVLPRSILPRR